MASKSIEMGAAGNGVKDAIRALRIDRRMTLTDMTEALKSTDRPLSKATLSQLETGMRRIDIDDLFAIAKALKVDPRELLRDAVEGEKPAEMVYDVLADIEHSIDRLRTAIREGRA